MNHGPKRRSSRRFDEAADRLYRAYKGLGTAGLVVLLVMVVVLPSHLLVNDPITS